MKRPVTVAVERARRRAPWLPAGLIRTAVMLRNVVVETVDGFRADRGVDLAASLAFTTLLLSVPLLATFSLLLAAFFKENVAEIVDLVNRILPYHAARVSDNLREFISESSTITGIGLTVLLVSSVRLIFVIEGIVNAVWGAPRRRGWVQRIAIYSLVLFALALLLGAIGIGIRSVRQMPEASGWLGSPKAQSAFLFGLEWGALTLLYRLLPNAHVRWSSAAVGAGTIAVLLQVLRGLFAVYVGALGRMNLITGYLALLLLSLLSIYFVWVLILLGVELTRAVQAHASRQRVPGGPRAGRAENAIRMLLRLVSGEVRPFRELYEGQEADSNEAETILNCLVDGGLASGDPSRGYTLARAPEKITVAEVVKAISPDLYTITPAEQDRVVLVLEPLFARLERERRALLDVTLADLAKE